MLTFCTILRLFVYLFLDESHDPPPPYTPGDFYNPQLSFQEESPLPRQVTPRQLPRPQEFDGNRWDSDYEDDISSMLGAAKM